MWLKALPPSARRHALHTCSASCPFFLPRLARWLPGSLKRCRTGWTMAACLGMAGTAAAARRARLSKPLHTWDRTEPRQRCGGRWLVRGPPPRLGWRTGSRPARLPLAPHTAARHHLWAPPTGKTTLSASRAETAKASPDAPRPTQVEAFMASPDMGKGNLPLAGGSPRDGGKLAVGIPPIALQAARDKLNVHLSPTASQEHLLLAAHPPAPHRAAKWCARCSTLAYAAYRTTNAARHTERAWTQKKLHEPSEAIYEAVKNHQGATRLITAAFCPEQQTETFLSLVFTISCPVQVYP